MSTLRSIFSNPSFRQLLRGLQTAGTSVAALIAVNILLGEGWEGLKYYGIQTFRKLPFINALIEWIVTNEVKNALPGLTGSSAVTENRLLPIPEYGLGEEDVVRILSGLKKNEQKAEDGKAFAYSYTSTKDMANISKRVSQAYELYASNIGDDLKQEKLLWRSWELFMHTNALNPMIYPSLRRMENEIVSMTAWMLNGDSQVAGSLTSGGTESILMAVKSYREAAKHARGYLSNPNMVVSQTIHPAFEKAAHYFNIEMIHVRTTADFRVDVAAVRAAINKDTILIVGSAPQYCHGVVDPIEELAALAEEKGIGMHVDACFGGFMLPWMERLGCNIPPFDFRVKGVTSISADVHKYGYASKGASVILYKNAKLRSYQYFSYSKWPGGLFVSPSMAGSRSGGIIAATWAAMVSTGQNGYMERAAALVEVTNTLIKGINAIEGIKVAVEPDMTSLAIVSSNRKVSVLAVAAIMEKSGWVMERQQLPESLHLSLLPQHIRSHASFLSDLAAAANEVISHPELSSQLAGVYGMVSAIPDKSIVDDFLVKLFGELFTLGEAPSIIEESRLVIEEESSERKDLAADRYISRQGSM